MCSPHNNFTGYCVDNRSANIKGALFIPLRGDRHDAHNFVSAAVMAGASGVVVDSWRSEWESLKDKATFIEVQDTLQALKDIARGWRSELKAKVIGLSGSNGKTTTKDFLIQMLSPLGRVHGSQGSFNNHWGLPFTLLDTASDCDYCVVEMGMNHSGELTELCQIAQPDVVGLTNVGRAHVGNFSDGIEGVARAKEELYQSAPNPAVFIFNIDNPWILKMYERHAHHRVITFSQKDFSADVYLRVKEKNATGFIVEGQIGGVLGQANIHFWGEQNIENLGVALALAYGSGVSPQSLWPQLSLCHTGWGRNQWLDTQSGAKILFDAYNANPESFAQLLRNLKETWNSQYKYVGIFGEMFELGDETSQEHQALGRACAQLPWSQCLFIGPSGEAFAQGWSQEKSSIKPVILGSYQDFLALNHSSMLDPKHQIIIKGSRGGALERVVQQLSPLGFTPKK
jgi:UDP-N-acetylmuramoyl-tripeptide--D-alanyl-D-alanine ligase